MFSRVQAATGGLDLWWVLEQRVAKEVWSIAVTVVSLTVAWFGVRWIKRGHGENRSPRTRGSTFCVFGALS